MRCSGNSDASISIKNYFNTVNTTWISVCNRNNNVTIHTHTHQQQQKNKHLIALNNIKFQFFFAFCPTAIFFSIFILTLLRHTINVVVAVIKVFISNDLRTLILFPAHKITQEQTKCSS